jgi:HAMP domain-containing protein
MGLRLKFNLILFFVFAAGFVAVGFVAHRYLERQAIEDAERAGLLTLDAAVIGNMDSRSATSLGSRLVEMKIREFPANEVQAGIGMESEAIARFKNNSNNQVADIFTTPVGEKRLVIARKISGADNTGKFRVATIDLLPVLALVKIALITLMSSLGAVFFAVFLVLNLMLDRMIVRPVAQMARQADAVSIGDFSIPEFKPTTKDEVGVLAIAFNRMRRSTEEAIKLLQS